MFHARYDDEREQREKAMMDIQDTQDRLGRAQTYGEGASNRFNKTAAEINVHKEQRKRYQFEATVSDNELEDELDDNLNEISDVRKRTQQRLDMCGSSYILRETILERYTLVVTRHTALSALYPLLPPRSVAPAAQGTRMLVQCIGGMFLSARTSSTLSGDIPWARACRCS